MDEYKVTTSKFPTIILPILIFDINHVDSGEQSYFSSTGPSRSLLSQAQQICNQRRQGINCLQGRVFWQLLS